MHRTVAIAAVLGAAVWHGVAPQAVIEPQSTPLEGQTLADAQSLFYNAQYEAAAELTLALRAAHAEDLAVYELRTTALLFQLKGALDAATDKEKAFKQCRACPALMDAFLSDTARGRSVARATAGEAERRSGAVFSREARPELRLAAAGDFRP